MHNPMVMAAGAKVEAMEAQARKAKWSWLPVIKASAVVSPGVSIKCEEVNLQTDGPDPHVFDYCHSVGDDGEDLNVQTVRGYLAQLGSAGVAVRLSAEAVFPLFTFGKLKNLKTAAEIGVAAAELEGQATRQETRKRVSEAYAGLLLARESIRILDEGWDVIVKERRKMKPADEVEDWEEDVEDSDNPTDIIKLEIGELELATRMREARKLEALALSALWTLAGEAAPRGFDVAQNQLMPRDPIGGLEDLAHYQDIAAHERPEARMASALVDVRRVQEKLARAMFLPDLGLVVGAKYGWASGADDYGPALYYTGRPNFSSVTVALGLSWNLDFHNKSFDLQMARAQAKRADYQREAARSLLAFEVEKAYRDFRSSRDDAIFAQLARDKSWQLVVSEQARSTISEPDFDALRKALIAWAEFEFAHFEAIQTQNVALATLERAVGKTLTSDDLPPADESPGGANHADGSVDATQSGVEAAHAETRPETETTAEESGNPDAVSGSTASPTAESPASAE
jgi:outer membrane protein TolC